MKEFKIKKSYEEVKIGGHVFKIDMGDEVLNNFRKDSPLVAEILKNYDAEDKDAIDLLRDTLEAIVNNIFMDSPFDTIYGLCNHSLISVSEILVQALDVINERHANIKKRMKITGK